MAEIAHFAAQITAIIACIAAVAGLFRVLIGKLPVRYVKVVRGNDATMIGILYIENTTDTPLFGCSMRVLWPIGALLGVQKYKNVSNDPADPTYVELEVSFSRSVTFDWEIGKGLKVEQPFLLKDCRSAPIILLNIVSARSIIRRAPIIVRSAQTDVNAVKT